MSMQPSRSPRLVQAGKTSIASAPRVLQASQPGAPPLHPGKTPVGDPDSQACKPPPPVAPPRRRRSARTRALLARVSSASPSPACATPGFGSASRRILPRSLSASASSDDKENAGAVVWSAPRRRFRTSRRPTPLRSLASPPSPVGVSAEAWAVMDAATGRVIGGRRHMEQRQVASLTKIVTASVVLQFAAVRPTLLHDVMVVSPTAAATIGTSAQLRTGDKLTVLDALYGLMLPSGNDAAMALAEHVGMTMGPTCESLPWRSAASPRALPLSAPSSPRGAAAASCVDTTTPHSSPPSPTSGTATKRSPPLPPLASDGDGGAARRWFVHAMNDLADVWGAWSTRFWNPHGMDAKPDPATHMSTASDVATLAFAAMRDARFRRVVGTRRHVAAVSRMSATSASPRRASVQTSAPAALCGQSPVVRSPPVGGLPASRRSPTRRRTPTRVTWDNTNKMLGCRAGVDGVKTGVTRMAGPCLATRLEEGGRPVIVVVLKCASKEARYSDTFTLARWGRR